MPLRPLILAFAFPLAALHLQGCYSMAEGLGKMALVFTGGEEEEEEKEGKEGKEGSEGNEGKVGNVGNVGSEGIPTSTGNVEATPSEIKLQNGLVVYYDFTGNTRDKSGNNNHATNHGATPAMDRYGYDGRAFKFDGVDDYMDILSTAQMNQKIDTTAGSTSVWLKIENKRDLSASSYVYGHNSNNFDRLHLVIRAPKSITTSIGKGTIMSGRAEFLIWYHIVMTWDEEVIRIYVNGVLDQEDEFLNPGFTFKGNDGFYIGRSWSEGPGFFMGSIDEFRLYDRVLSVSEVEALYEQ